MSKTHKHQKMYLMRHWGYASDRNPYIKVYHRGFIYWITPPPVHDIYPFPEYSHSIELDQSKYYKESNRKLRKKWKRLLHENDEFKIGSESLKPENVDWDIW